MKVTVAPLLLVLGFVVACQDTSETAPHRITTNALTSLQDVVDGPEGLPNVIRYNDQFAFGIQDPETNLLAWAGLPASPMLSTACAGGSEPFATVDVHDAGLLRDVVHRVLDGSSVNLYVYNRSTFLDFCRSTPIAQGTGAMRYTDNEVDETSAFPGANAWGFTMEGAVNLASGGDAHLIAHNRFLVSPSGALRRIFRKVDLSTP